MRNIAYGSYGLRVEAPGFSPVVQSMTLASGVLARADLRFTELSRIHATPAFPVNGVAGITLRFGGK